MQRHKMFTERGSHFTTVNVAFKKERWGRKKKDGESTEEKSKLGFATF